MSSLFLGFSLAIATFSIVWMHLRCHHACWEKKTHPLCLLPLPLAPLILALLLGLSSLDHFLGIAVLHGGGETLGGDSEEKKAILSWVGVSRGEVSWLEARHVAENVEKIIFVLPQCTLQDCHGLLHQHGAQAAHLLTGLQLPAGGGHEKCGVAAEALEPGFYCKNWSDLLDLILSLF